MNLEFVKFPIDLGIVGYRVCFTNTKIKEKLKEVRVISDLRQFTHGQGQDWADVDILKYNKFKVVTSANYENLFNMVAAGRFDLFCRGINELYDEYNSHKSIAGLTYDETFSIVYPFPRFFYTNKINSHLITRIEKGLMIAYKDGSLMVLWKKEYQRSIDFVKLKNRKLFYLENPNLKSLHFDYKKFFIDPLKTSNEPLNSKHKSFSFY